MLTDLNFDNLVGICMNMRKRDADEILAQRPHNNLYQLAFEMHEMFRNYGYCKIGWSRGRPVAVGALTTMYPGVWQASMFGTDEFQGAAMPLLSWFRRQAAAIIAEGEGHRLQCDSQVDHHEAHKMLRALGAVEEGPPMLKFGKDKSDFQRFAWVSGVNDQILLKGYKRAA